MNPIMLYASLAIIIAGFASGWAVRDWKADADILKAMEKTERVRIEMQDKADTKADEYEKSRSRLEPSRVEVRNNIREIYRNVEVPAECAANDSVVGLLESTRLDANSSASGQPRRELPANPQAAGAVN
jgi:hypothetical protein